MLAIFYIVITRLSGHTTPGSAWYVTPTNQLENFFSQLTRSIDGTHYSASKEHLNHHLGAFDFYYSSPKMGAAVGWVYVIR